jgi:hypothetical protein
MVQLGKENADVDQLRKILQKRIPEPGETWSREWMKDMRKKFKLEGIHALW